MPDATKDGKATNVPTGSNDSSSAKPCPICGKPSGAQTRPFCSKRCADVDLHRWLGGNYAIPVVEGQSDVSEE